MSSRQRPYRLLNRSIVVLALTALAPAIAAPAPASDTLEQRVRPCTACHGENRIDLHAGYVPHLDGKPAGYLFNQLVNYREARRSNRPMRVMTSHLSDDYLWEMAGHFAALTTPYPAPAPMPANPALRERGEQLVRRGDPQRDIPSCQSCHGEALTGVEPNTPGLLGLPSHYLMAQFGAWAAGSRRAAAPDCMHTITGRLDAFDIEAVSKWLSAQSVPADARPAAAPIAEPPLECGSVALPGR